MKLTKRALDAVKPDPSQDVYLWDDELAGYGLRIKPTGIRSFFVQYRNSMGNSRRVTLGKFSTSDCTQAHTTAVKGSARDLLLHVGNTCPE